MKTLFKVSSTIFLITICLTQSLACTSLLVTKGASADGSTMITYTADSHTLFGELYYFPAMDYSQGTKMKIKELDSGKPLGEIEQAAHTFQVVGYMNEHQLAISETTFEGRKELKDSTGIIDYGSLMFIALQRTKTARDAIKLMTELVSKYGYYSTGESFSIADPNEVWIMEMIGKGPGNKGAVWVAVKVPDGYVSAHANQSRIRQIPLKDKENCMYSKDVISFAKEKGYFKGDDKDFSFADAYCPLSYLNLRACEGRVYAAFHRMAPSLKLSMDYVKGKENATPLPLWIKADKKLSVKDMTILMRDHYEGTEWDMTKDIGAGPFLCPYRWRPMVWTADSVKYMNERAASTQQTGFSFISQSRSFMPDPVGGLLWFGVDDTYSTVYMPIYCCIKEVPPSLTNKTADMMKFSWESAFWVFNFVSNFAYLRYNTMIKDIQKIQEEIENGFFNQQSAFEKNILTALANNEKEATIRLTEHSYSAANNTVRRWRELGEYLIVKYMDGNIKKEKDGQFEDNGFGIPVYPMQPGYSKDWYKLIKEKDGEKFRMR